MERRINEHEVFEEDGSLRRRRTTGDQDERRQSMLDPHEAAPTVGSSPRTQAPRAGATTGASLSQMKSCEQCGGPHDGSYASGRFCSPRCARTVGGIATKRRRRTHVSRDSRSFGSNATRPIETPIAPRLPPVTSQAAPTPSTSPSQAWRVSIENLVRPGGGHYSAPEYWEEREHERSE
mmetsp:Transcript_9880/g.20765  ORF Transcript_9880/g.20765 Transcript_9880/m.20765 type:complete len:179 (+) Transcript_9880:159-695(+)